MTPKHLVLKRDKRFYTKRHGLVAFTLRDKVDWRRVLWVVKLPVDVYIQMGRPQHIEVSAFAASVVPVDRGGAVTEDEG